MHRELLNISIYKVDEPVPDSSSLLTELTMTYSDYKVFYDYIETEGLKYDRPDSDKREYYDLYDDWIALKQKEDGSKKFEAVIYVKKRESQK